MSVDLQGYTGRCTLRDVHMGPIEMALCFRIGSRSEWWSARLEAETLVLARSVKVGSASTKRERFQVLTGHLAQHWLCSDAVGCAHGGGLEERRAVGLLMSL